VGSGGTTDIALELRRISRYYARTFNAPDEVRDVMVYGPDELGRSLLAELDKSSDFRAAPLRVPDLVSEPLCLPSVDLADNEHNAVAIGAGAGLILDPTVVGPNLASKPDERQPPQVAALIRALFIPTLIAAGIWGSAIGVQQHLERRVHRLQIQVNHPSPVETEYRELKMDLYRTEQRAARIAELADGLQERRWNDVLEAIRTCVPEHLWLTRVRTLPEGQLSVTGAAFDESLAYEFVRNIGASPLIENTTIISQTNVQQDEVIVHEFSVECTVILDHQLSDTTDS
jgi:Tfp pilus assembly protein PilN